MPYVVTNPEPGIILTEKDYVLILSQETPGDDAVNWGGPLERKEEMNFSSS